MPLLQENPTTPTLFKETTPTTQAPKLIHMLWMLTQSTLKSSPKKKGKNASRRDDASDAENPDTTQGTVPHSNTKPPQRKPKPRKIARIEEVLEVQQGEEVSDEEELITKLHIQDF